MICLKQTLFFSSPWVRWAGEGGMGNGVREFRIQSCKMWTKVDGRTGRLMMWTSSEWEIGQTSWKSARCRRRRGLEEIAQADDEFFLFNLMLRSDGGWFRSQSVVESSSACSFSSLNSRLHLLSLTPFFCVFFSYSSVVVENLLHPSTFRLVSIMSHEHHFVNRTKKRSLSFRLVSSSTPSHYTLHSSHRAPPVVAVVRHSYEEFRILPEHKKSKREKTQTENLGNKTKEIALNVKK